MENREGCDRVNMQEKEFRVGIKQGKMVSTPSQPGNVNDIFCPRSLGQDEHVAVRIVNHDIPLTILSSSLISLAATLILT